MRCFFAKKYIPTKKYRRPSIALSGQITLALNEGDIKITQLKQNKIFFGVSGAYTMGALTSLNIIITNNLNPLISSFFFCTLLFYIFFEVFFSFLRKIIQKKSPIHPDNEHLHMLSFYKISKNLVSEMKNTFMEIKQGWPKTLPKNIIHGDLFIDNIFFHRGKFFGFIDFYFSSNDFEAYELATCINALCFNKKKKTFSYDKGKTLQLIKGYETIRKLQKKEKDCLNILCKGSALRYLATRSYDYINTPKSAIIKKKDPREYIQKLAFHKKINSFSSYIK